MENMQKKVNTYIQVDMRSYDEDTRKYGDAVSLTLPIIVLVLTCGLFFGLMAGCIGYQRKRNPNNRTCFSNCGGNLLVITSYLIPPIMFIFLIILMVLFFIAGFLSMACNIFEHPKLFSDVVNVFQEELGRDSTLIKLKDVDFSESLKKCEENKSIFKAFAPLKQVLKIDETLKDVKVEIPDDELKKVTNIAYNFDEFRLSRDVTDGITKALDIIKTEWNKIKDAVGSDPEGKELASSYESLETWNEQDRLTEFNTNLTQKAKVSYEEIQKEYGEKIKKTAENAVKRYITDDMIRCRPIFDMYESVKAISCHTLLDPLNGLWFGLGICVSFLLIGMVFALVLSRHFLRMKHYHGDEEDQEVTRATPRGKPPPDNGHYPPQSPPIGGVFVIPQGPPQGQYDMRLYKAY